MIMLKNEKLNNGKVGNLKIWKIKKKSKHWKIKKINNLKTSKIDKLKK